MDVVSSVLVLKSTIFFQLTDIQMHFFQALNYLLTIGNLNRKSLTQSIQPFRRSFGTNKKQTERHPFAFEGRWYNTVMKKISIVRC